MEMVGIPAHVGIAMAKSIINVSKVTRDLLNIRKKIDRMEDIATTRTLNAILLDERRVIGDEIAEEYGLKKTSVRKRIKAVRATRINKNIKLDMSSLRVHLAQARKIKGGLSFRKKGGGRTKIRTPIEPGGSKPFVIRAKAGGVSGGPNIETKGGAKKVPVFVPAINNKKRGIKRRKVKTLLGSTIRRMALELQIDSGRLERRVIRDFPKEYRKQLKKARFTGGK